MLKKIILILSAIIIFSLPLQEQRAHAITGKVISLAAKKMAKEVVKDAAVSTAGNLALDLWVDENMQKKVKPGFTLTCLPGGKVDGTCTKPMQVKTTLTDVDKTNIGNTVELELEKSINGGVHFSKWQKFLDWVAPLFLVSLALTALTYAMDGDVREMFNDIAITALTALGLLEPIEGEQKIVDSNGNDIELPPLKNEEATSQRLDAYGQYEISFRHSGTSQLTETKTINLEFPVTQNYILVQNRVRNTTEGDWNSYSNIRHTTAFSSYTPTLLEIPFNGQMKMRGRSGKIDVNYNNEKLLENYSGQHGSEILTLNSPSIDSSVFIEKAYQIIPDKTGGTEYVVEEFHAFGTNDTAINLKASRHYTSGSTWNGFMVQEEVNPGQEIKNRFTFYPMGKIEETGYTPTFEDFQAVDPMMSSTYTAHGNTIFAPPASLPYYLPDGITPVYPVTNPEYDPVTNPTAEPNIFVDPNGNPVPNQDSVTVGDPVITEDAWGNPQVTPPATSTTPIPEPIPLTPPKTQPDVPTDQPVFPEGESCSVGLKLPKFNPLMHTMSDAFPFSIPFDLKDGFDAIFAEMGSEKPEFDYKFSFMGEEQIWKITLPDYFDSWKVFTDSFLIFIFDVGIIYAIYRFMGGGS